MIDSPRLRAGWLSLAIALGAAGCESEPAMPPDAGELDGGSCESRQQAYAEFVAAHSSCSVDEDCAVIGDCGPNADFAPVRADAAAQAATLQAARCSAAFDGPMYHPVCDDGTCGLKLRTDTCCGCPPPGWDAGVGDGG